MQVEEGVAEQSPADAHDPCTCVDGSDGDASTLRPEPPARRRVHQMDHEREEERLDDHRHAAHGRRSVVPAHRIGGEPRDPCQPQHEEDAARREHEQHEQPGCQQADSGGQVGGLRGA